MADQRPTFRFRLPWLPGTATPPPRPTFPTRQPAQPTPTTTPAQTTPQTTATQAPPQPSATITPPRPTTSQTPATQARSQPAISTTPSSTTPQSAETQVPSQPSITTTPPTTTSQTAETQVPSQTSTTTTSAPTTQTAERTTVIEPSVTTRTTPTTTPQTPEAQTAMQPTASITASVPTAERPTFKPPVVATAQGPPPQSQTSRTELEPSTPSRATSQPRVPSQPASPSRVATQTRAPSQPSIPPRGATGQRAVSLPSSPSRRSPQLSSAPRTATQPSSPSLTSIQDGHTSSPPLPPGMTAQQQPITADVMQLTSPPQTDQGPTQKSSQTSVSSAEIVPPTSDKQEPKSTESDSTSLELQPKIGTGQDNFHDSEDRASIKTSIPPNEMAQQPAKESGMRAAEVLTTTEGPEKPAVNQKSSTSTINGEPESLSKDMKPEEPKEVKEVQQNLKDEAHDRARHIYSDLKGAQGQTLQTKDLPSIPFQTEQAQKTISRKETTATSPSNGKQIKIPSAHAKNKTMMADSQQKLGNSSGDHIPLHKEIRDDISKLVNKMAIGDSKHSTDDRPVSVITLAGENRGASMHIGFDSSKKEEAIHIRRGYKIKPDESAEATTDGEECSRGKSDNPNAEEDQATEAYVNSNVQGMNNSILFNTSITERNPGVHLIHSHFSMESKKPSGKSELIETRKAEFNTTPSQKLTHEPAVRRRCLRGLFLESSDSELDTAKPRRHHGCRVRCNEKSKENNIDVV